jgi:hypothetical protein
VNGWTGGWTGATGVAFLDDWSETGRLVGGRAEGVAEGLSVWEAGEIGCVGVLEDESEATFCCESAPTIMGWWVY